MIAAAGWIFVSAATAAFAADASRPPNVIFILADDLGREHLGCYGQKLIQTPHIDRLASEGMKFTQCYAGSNVCAPSRSTLMTGLHAGHTPVRANGGMRFLLDSDVTLAEVLKSAGYATGGFGKWGLGDETTSGCAIRQGFDQWFGQYNQGHAHFYYPFFLWQNLQAYTLPENNGGKRSRYSHDEIHAQALDFIRANRQRPFFCYAAYTLPHVELVVPEDSLAQYAGKFPKLVLPDSRPGYIGSDDAYATYAAMVGRLDRGVGEILALVKELGLDEITVVLFASDNGPQGGLWKPVVEFFGGEREFRGEKGSFYEGGIRTPLLVRWPKHIAPGKVSDHVCAFWDMLPTLAELAGAAAPGGLDGVSIVPTLLGQSHQQAHEFMYWEYPAVKGQTQAVRMGDWKAVRPKPTGPLELYNLATDLRETTNVAAEHPEVLKQIDAILASQHTNERDYPPDEHRRGVKDYVR